MTNNTPKPTRQGDSGAIVRPESKGNSQSFASHTHLEGEPIPVNTTDETITKMVADFEPGDVIVGDNGTHLTVDNIESSSVMPGCYAVENEFGTLYLDAELEYQVVNEFYVAPSASAASEVTAVQVPYVPAHSSHPADRLARASEVKVGDQLVTEHGIVKVQSVETLAGGLVEIRYADGRGGYRHAPDEAVTVVVPLTLRQDAENWYYDAPGNLIETVSRGQQGYAVTRVLNLPKDGDIPARKIRAILSQGSSEALSSIQIAAFDVHKAEWSTFHTVAGSSFHNDVAAPNTKDSDEDVLFDAESPLTEAILEAITILR